MTGRTVDPYPPDTKWRVRSPWCQGEAVIESGNPRLGEPMPPHDCTGKDCRINTISGPISPRQSADTFSAAANEVPR